MHRFQLDNESYEELIIEMLEDQARKIQLSCLDLQCLQHQIRDE